MVPLNELEIQELRHTTTLRELDSLGQSRAAAYLRSVEKAAKMRQRGVPEDTAINHFFEIGDMVKLKRHAKSKFEFRWKGPYHIVGLGHAGVYSLMAPDGRQLDTPVDQRDLLSILIYNV